MPDVIAVIPQPAVLERTGDAPFVLTEATTVVVDGRPDLIGIAVLAADLLGRVGGRAVEVRYAESGASDIVRLRLVESLPPGDEAYRRDLPQRAHRPRGAHRPPASSAPSSRCAS